MGGGKQWPNSMHVDREIIRKIVEVETFNPLREEDMQQQTVERATTIRLSTTPRGIQNFQSALTDASHT
jgi:hypothetical protein